MSLWETPAPDDDTPQATDSAGDLVTSGDTRPTPLQRGGTSYAQGLNDRGLVSEVALRYGGRLMERVLDSIRVYPGLWDTRRPRPRRG